MKKVIINNDGEVYLEEKKVLQGITGYDKKGEHLVVGCPYCDKDHQHSLKSAGELRKCPYEGRDYFVSRVAHVLD